MIWNFWGCWRIVWWGELIEDGKSQRAFFFFFQAEDGIRDIGVTGVQTCALPIFLLIAGLILSTLYRDNTERAFDQRLLVYANTLASNLVGPGDPDRDLGPIGDPRFELPLSGWDWQVALPNAAPGEVRSSKSLFGGQLPTLASGDNRFGQIRRGYGRAPDDRNLRIIERDIDLGEDGRYISRVAGPADEIEGAVGDFIFALTVTFALLGIGLGFTTLLQIRFGLRPLANLRSALGAIRQGEAERIVGEYPRDISPLASELNLLLDTNREILERARTQVGNLAHALKTPLSVIMNEAENAPEDVAARVREQATLMRDQVNYYLDRARAAALAGTLGTLTEAEPVIAGLARTFAKIYRDKDLEVELAIPPDLRFRGEKDRKSTRLNSSHANISYAVFCLKKKKNTTSPLTALLPLPVSASTPMLHGRSFLIGVCRVSVEPPRTDITPLPYGS